MAGLVISDASPIIGLARVDGLGWLKPLFGQVWIPPEVASEVLADSPPLSGAPMSTMNVSLPAEMKRWVEQQADSGRFSNSSDYVRDLIRRDQERQAKIAHLQRLIDEGLNSGVSDMTMADIRREARSKLTG